MEPEQNKRPRRRDMVDRYCAEYLAALEAEDYHTIHRIRRMAEKEPLLKRAINELRQGLEEEAGDAE